MEITMKTEHVHPLDAKQTIRMTDTEFENKIASYDFETGRVADRPWTDSEWLVPYDELMRDLSSHTVESSDGDIDFLCPLHDPSVHHGIVKRLGKSSYEYSVTCFACGSRDQEWIEKFYLWDLTRPGAWTRKISKPVIHEDKLTLPAPTTSAPLFRPHENPLEANYPDFEPEFLPDATGNFLIYPGELHMFYGKPQTFKSWAWMALFGTCDFRVLDFENGRRQMAKRLKALEVDQALAGVFCFVDSKEQLLSRIQEYIITKPQVVVIDGLPGLLRMMGKDGDSNLDVSEVFSTCLDPLKNAGISVLVLDHLPKSVSEGSDDFPIGAQTKKSAMGVTYLFRSRPNSNIVDVLVSKDRHGSIGDRCDESGWPRSYGSIDLDRGEEGLNPSIEPLKIPYLSGQQYEPFEAMRMIKVWNAIDASPGVNQTDLENSVKGNHKKRKETVEKLIQLGYLRTTKSRNAIQHFTKDALKFEWQSRGSFG
jgi:hypothetical protein